MDEKKAIKAEEKQGQEGHMQRRVSDAGRSLDSGEKGMARRAPASLFSLTPRDLFSASPFDLMRRFTEEMDRFFEGTSRERSASNLWAPPIEVSEKDGQLTICAELPGLNKEDVKVELTQAGLTISGERKREQEDRRDGLYRSERSYGWFKRTIPIPDEAQVEQAKATFDNGMLTVLVPVPEIRKRGREIPIESSSGPSQAQSTSERASASEQPAAKAA
jgi:HSP20 family protein